MLIDSVICITIVVRVKTGTSFGIGFVTELSKRFKRIR